jgi:hypothetical protein
MAGTDPATTCAAIPRDIGLSASAARAVSARPPRLVIDNPVSHRRLDLPKISTGEMVALLRQIVVGRLDLGGEDEL